MGKNVAVFVDVANIFYAAKAAGADIDYVLLLKAATAGRDLVRAYAYTGLDPDNENQRNFHSFLARHDYKVVSKDIRKYGDGKVKANLDIELVVDMMKTSRNLDVAVVVSGDGDFAPAIRAVQEMGVRCEVISFRGNTSSDLIEVADKFTDITQLAKVERGSTASGRRVASDEEDLSMTEVPEKESEGTGRGRARGRGRGRITDRPAEAAPARAPREVRSREGRPVREPAAAVRSPERPAEGAGVPIIAMPGERLARVRAIPPEPLEIEEEEELEAIAIEADGAEPSEVEAGAEGEGELDADGQRRRRRRRGGRGRGRGRGREEGAEGAPLEAGPEPEPAEPPVDEAEPVRRAPRPAAFGSVWDSQIGVPSGPVAAGPPVDEEFDDEPEIPEYLLAEQRRNRPGPGLNRGRPGQRGGRGGAYAAAVDRERYGSARPGSGSRFSEPVVRQGGGRSGPPPRDNRRPAPGPAPRQERPRVERGRDEEPWSEVPPELEQLLRAQFAQKQARTGQPASGAGSEPTSAVPTAATPSAGPRRRAPKPAEVAPAGVTPVDVAPAQVEAPKRRTRRAAAPVVEGGSGTAPEATTAAEVVPAEAPKRRARKAVTAPEGGSAAEAAPTAAPAAAAAPRRRTRATTPADAAPATEAASDVPAEAPKRRTRRAAAPTD